jgi:phosphatidylglycerophosphatase A
MAWRLQKIVATAGGIGYLPIAPGTWAAGIAAVFWFYFNNVVSGSYNIQLLLTAIVIVAGIYYAGKILSKSEKDPSYVVIDEVAGLFVTLIFIPPTFYNVLLGFILFRFFDIVKPLGVRRMEKYPRGWGIMMDDILAGIYSNVVIRLILLLKLW